MGYGTRAFVEVSPRDTNWVVGIRWDQVVIGKEENWKGESRQGACHGEACTFVRESWEEKMAGGE